MPSQNKTESYICPTAELTPNPMNTAVIENMVDTKKHETSDNANATIKCGNKIENIRSKLEIMATPESKTRKGKKWKNVQVALLLIKLRRKLKEGSGDG